MSKSPVIMEFALISASSIVNISLIPTNAKPVMTKPIPIHSLIPNFLLRNPIENIPVKTITDPRNIWKLLA